MDLAIGLILSNFVFVLIIFLMLMLDKEGLGVALKLRFMRGYVGVIMIGKDKRIYFEAVKISSKETDTELITVRKLPYVFDYDKIMLFKNRPFLLYKEGVAQPLEIKGKDTLGYGNLTPELFTNIIAIARASGQIPKAFDMQMESLQRIAIFVGAFASIGAVICIFFMIKPDITNILTGLNGIGQAITNLAVPTG